MANVLVVSAMESMRKLISELLPHTSYPLIQYVNSALEAKKKLRQQPFDLCIVHPPLKDEFGIRTAREIKVAFSTGVLLLVKNDVYDQVLYQVQEQGIFTMGLPASRTMLGQTIENLRVAQDQMRQLSIQLQREKKKIQAQKAIFRAKLILIESHHWTEEKAHHYIEKVAMDHGLKKEDIAKKIIEGGKSLS